MVGFTQVGMPLEPQSYWDLVLSLGYYCKQVQPDSGQLYRCQEVCGVIREGDVQRCSEVGGGQRVERGLGRGIRAGEQAEGEDLSGNTPDPISQF